MGYRWMAMAGLLSGILLLTACADTPGRYIGEEPSALKGPAKEFTIHAQPSGYDTKEIRVKRGDTVRIKLVNVQGMHSLKISGYNEEVRGGKTITFVADQAGEFEFSCNISCGKDHKQMKGTFIVK